MTLTQPGQAMLKGLPCPDCAITLTLTHGQHLVLTEVAHGTPTERITQRLRAGQNAVRTSTDRDRAGADAIRDVVQALGATGRPHAVDVACRTKLLVPPRLRPPEDGIPEPLRRTAELLADGLEVRPIARKLGLAVETVNARLKRLRKALGVENSPNLIFCLHAIGELPVHHPCPCRPRRARNR
ncbi:LuxR C-terminal-related transcriptional regulator [Kitasatospora sp. NPDC094016]|uniref:helix-turn-helix transcriptional regulator n=1 Tax=Kitasatospora sp. NPDC094016 TaxID=3154986 RepID=UPI0033282DD5